MVRRPSFGRFDSTKRDEVWSRAVRAFQSRGYLVAVSDRAGGILSTQQMPGPLHPCGILSCQTREVVQVTLTEDGAASVNIVREVFYSGHGEAYWMAPTDQRSVARIEAEQSNLLLEITLLER